MNPTRIFLILMIAGIFFSCEEEEFYNPYNQLQEDLAILDEYLSENNIEAEKSPSGLRYIIQDEGMGSYPVSGNLVKVHYVGTLLDGTKFDSSYDAGKPISYIHGQRQVIRAWDEGLSYIRERGKITLYVPSVLAYGRTGKGDLIGPNENLIFEIELVSVQ